MASSSQILTEKGNLRMNIRNFQKFGTVILICWTLILLIGSISLVRAETALKNQEPEVRVETIVQTEQAAVISQHFDAVEFLAEGLDYPEDVRTTQRMAQAHKLAETARLLGLAEDDPVILKAKAIWAQERQNLDILAKTISKEAPGCPYEHQLTVGCVVINRVRSSKFPNTIYDVIVQKNQYNPAYARDFDGVKDEFYAVAKAVLDGEYSIPSNVLYQSNHKNGTGVWWESHVKTPYWESVTYFCYG